MLSFRGTTFRWTFGWMIWSLLRLDLCAPPPPPRKNDTFVRSAASAPFGGDWWRATNRILQGCPVSVILVNALMGVWKAELDSLREQVVVVTKDLPPCRTLAADESTSVVLERQGPGRADIGAGGYADDTEVVAPSAAALRRTVPATQEWLQLTR